MEKSTLRRKISIFFKSRAGMATIGIIAAVATPTLALFAKLIA
ncbi:hypothetical protein NX871_17750 [Burkholderia thailandensis]|nr:hypothetical protein [Burkholderia thailandensis]MCS6471788.1 hypothetical protein [Burkholderia thailandensis]